MGLLDFLKKIPTSNEIKGSLGEWLASAFAKTMLNNLILVL